MNIIVLALVLALASTVAAIAQGQQPTEGQALLRKYAGSDDTDSLLREPRVGAELARLLTTPQQQLLRQNLDVRGSVDVVSGFLSIVGNASRGGGLEEAVVCIGTYQIQTHVGIFSRGQFSVFTRAATYDNLPICIKDWITQVGSGHRDRFTQPKNVQVVTRK